MNNIKSFLQDYSINGIVKINIDKKLYIKNGYSNVKNKTKFNKDSMFPLGSISKLIYGTIIVELLDKGKIKSLNDKVSKYLKKLKHIKCFKKITILNCLLHTSNIKSLRDNVFFDKNKKYNIDEFINLIDELYLYDENIKNKFNYTIVNYFIIGKIIDVITGSSSKYIKKMFNKLKIKEIYFIDDIYNKQYKIKSKFINNFSLGYEYKDNNIVIKNINKYWFNKCYGCDICLSYINLNKFIKRRKKLFDSKKNYNLLLKDYDIYIIKYNNNNNKYISYIKSIIGSRYIKINKKKYIIVAGHFPGYHVSAVFSKNFKKYINVFSNVDKSDNEINMDEMAKNFLFILKTKYRFYIKPKKNKIKKLKDINKYIGKYKNDYTFYEIYKKKDKLYLYSRKQTNELIYLGNNNFYRNPFSFIKIKNNILFINYYYSVKYEMKKEEDLYVL